MCCLCNLCVHYPLSAFSDIGGQSCGYDNRNRGLEPCHSLSAQSTGRQVFYVDNALRQMLVINGIGRIGNSMGAREPAFVLIVHPFQYKYKM